MGLQTTLKNSLFSKINVKVGYNIEIPTFLIKKQLEALKRLISKKPFLNPVFFVGITLLLFGVYIAITDLETTVKTHENEIPIINTRLSVSETFDTSYIIDMQSHNQKQVDKIQNDPEDVRDTDIIDSQRYCQTLYETEELTPIDIRNCAIIADYDSEQPIL